MLIININNIQIKKTHGLHKWLICNITEELLENILIDSGINEPTFAQIVLLFTDLTERYIVEKVITHVIMKTVKSNSSEITEGIKLVTIWKKGYMVKISIKEKMEKSYRFFRLYRQY